ncbi:MAG TPA: hypothetical protein PKH65_01140 [Bacteroidia bacterium]|nr:hypothetical protein [Bacteroidia bacterium]HNT79258.1 hypothetical protein [Bacteroidia bacterium]
MRKVIVIVLLSVLISCTKDDQFSEIPNIELKNIFKTGSSVRDSSVFITLNFTDGDGDIGLKDTDTQAPYDTCSIYQYNYFAKIFERKNGIYKQFVFTGFNSVCNAALSQTLDSLYFARIPFLTPTGQNKSLEGEITLEIPFLQLGYLVKNDTMRFEVFIYDRALHKSNVVTTSDIVLTTQP